MNEELHAMQQSENTNLNKEREHLSNEEIEEKTEDRTQKMNVRT